MSKYLPEYDQIAYKAIALCGVDSAAWRALGVTERTFYRWIKKYESFGESVKNAHDFHLESSPDSLRIKLIGYILESFENGGEVVTITTNKTTRVVQRDNRDRISFVVDTNETTTTTEVKGISKWIADKIMANSPGLNEAMIKVLNSGHEITKKSESEVNQ